MIKFVHLQKVILYPFAILYGIIIWIRNRLFDFHILPVKEFDLPIIAVGNLTAGGTGKTPVVEYLVNLLRNDFVVATLSRGYKRKTRGFFLANENSTALEIGDEPKQIKQKFTNVAVAVDANRVRGIQKLLKLVKGLNVVVLDDAYQHRYVQPGITILLVNYQRNIFDDHLLPLGRLREPVSERDRADVIIVTKCPADIKPIDLRLLEKKLKMYAYQRVYFTKIKYLNPVPVFNNQQIENVTLENIAQKQQEIIVISGIADNQSFVNYLEQYFTTVHAFLFPDHYNYQAKDLHEIIDLHAKLNTNKNRPYLFTTEKDAMRLLGFNELDDEIKKSIYYIPIEIEFLENANEAFNTYIKNYVRNNRPDNILHRAKSKSQKN